MGEAIDKPIAISEESAALHQPQPMYQARVMAMSSSADEAVAQPSGIINIRASVIATFSMK